MSYIVRIVRLPNTGQHELDHEESGKYYPGRSRPCGGNDLLMICPMGALVLLDADLNLQDGILLQATAMIHKRTTK